MKEKVVSISSKKMMQMQRCKSHSRITVELGLIKQISNALSYLCLSP
jgi:hypothetical protein